MTNGLVLTMHRGPFQNNGATPWYTTLALGTPGQPLKLAIDTGTNITWTTSTLCPEDQCLHSSGGRFDYAASTTFSFTDCLRRPYSFGPWGTMQVESGQDLLHVSDIGTVDTRLLLAAHYSGDQFQQLDWDGGVGFPSSSAYVEGRSSFFLQTLVRSGHVSPSQPFVAFDWNAGSKLGSCEIGAVDASKTKEPGLFLPWSVYSQLPGVEYIWSTELKAYCVGEKILANNLMFALDSGSSQFKGDEALMHQTLALIARGGHPPLKLVFAEGEITLGADLYNVAIEAGPDQGQTVPQFMPLGLPGLVLVGSLIMEHCYTVHEYQIVQASSGDYSLAPVGIWLFNKPDGPQIITRPSTRRFDPGTRKVASGPFTVPASPSSGAYSSAAGTWSNEYGSTMTLSLSDNTITGVYQSSTGSSGKYEVSGYQSTTPITSEHGCPVALAIDWRSLGDEAPDPSWNWASGLSGQISLVEGEEVLTLSHLLIASSEFPGLAQSGTYLDKLTYRRTSSPSRAPAPSEDLDAIANALEGLWETTDGLNLQLIVRTDKEQRVGHVSGTLSSPSGSVKVTGFTDIRATASGLDSQSVSLCTLHDPAVASMSGTLQLIDDQLHLTVMTSRPTAKGNTYLQTSVEMLTFRRS